MQEIIALFISVFIFQHRTRQIKNNIFPGTFSCKAGELFCDFTAFHFTDNVFYCCAEEKEFADKKSTQLNTKMIAFIRPVENEKRLREERRTLLFTLRLIGRFRMYFMIFAR